MSKTVTFTYYGALTTDERTVEIKGWESDKLATVTVTHPVSTMRLAPVTNTSVVAIQPQEALAVAVGLLAYVKDQNIVAPEWIKDSGLSAVNTLLDLYTKAVDEGGN